MGIYLGPFRFTKRGVRIRIGPRAARLHVGAGGTGFSTGAGPFTWYKPLGGKRRRRPSARRASPPRYYASTPQPQLPEPTAPHPSGYGRAAMPRRSSVYDPRSGNQPSGPPMRNGWHWWTRRRVIVAASLFAVLVLIGVIANAASPPTPTPAGQHKPAGAASPSPSPSVYQQPCRCDREPGRCHHHARPAGHHHAAHSAADHAGSSARADRVLPEGPERQLLRAWPVLPDR